MKYVIIENLNINNTNNFDTIQREVEEKDFKEECAVTYIQNEMKEYLDNSGKEVIETFEWLDMPKEFAYDFLNYVERGNGSLYNWYSNTNLSLSSDKEKELFKKVNEWLISKGVSVNEDGSFKAIINIAW